VDVNQVDAVVNAVPPGWHVVTIAVPTRALRVVRDDACIKYRVEQLDARDWSWVIISTHTGDEPWESWGPAWQDMVDKQARLKEKLKLAKHNDNMARIAAQEKL
jgi:hypothetical protein